MAVSHHDAKAQQLTCVLYEDDAYQHHHQHHHQQQNLHPHRRQPMQDHSHHHHQQHHHQGNLNTLPVAPRDAPRDHREAACHTQFHPNAHPHPHQPHQVSWTSTASAPERTSSPGAPRGVRKPRSTLSEPRPHHQPVGAATEDHLAAPLPAIRVRPRQASYLCPEVGSPSPRSPHFASPTATQAYGYGSPTSGHRYSSSPTPAHGYGSPIAAAETAKGRGALPKGPGSPRGLEPRRRSSSSMSSLSSMSSMSSESGSGSGMSPLWRGGSFSSGNSSGCCSEDDLEDGEVSATADKPRRDDLGHVGGAPCKLERSLSDDEGDEGGLLPGPVQHAAGSRARKGEAAAAAAAVNGQKKPIRKQCAPSPAPPAPVRLERSLSNDEDEEVAEGPARAGKCTPGRRACTAAGPAAGRAGASPTDAAARVRSRESSGRHPASPLGDGASPRASATPKGERRAVARKATPAPEKKHRQAWAAEVAVAPPSAASSVASVPVLGDPLAAEGKEQDMYTDIDTNGDMYEDSNGLSPEHVLGHGHLVGCGAIRMEAMLEKSLSDSEDDSGSEAVPGATMGLGPGHARMPPEGMRMHVGQRSIRLERSLSDDEDQEANAVGMKGRTVAVAGPVEAKPVRSSKSSRAAQAASGTRSPGTSAARASANHHRSSSSGLGMLARSLSDDDDDDNVPAVPLPKPMRTPRGPKPAAHVRVATAAPGSGHASPRRKSDSSTASAQKQGTHPLAHHRTHSSEGSRLARSLSDDEEAEGPAKGRGASAKGNKPSVTQGSGPKGSHGPAVKASPQQQQDHSRRPASRAVQGRSTAVEGSSAEARVKAQPAAMARPGSRLREGSSQESALVGKSVRGRSSAKKLSRSLLDDE